MKKETVMKSEQKRDQVEQVSSQPRAAVQDLVGVLRNKTDGSKLTIEEINEAIAQIGSQQNPKSPPIGSKGG